MKDLMEKMKSFITFDFPLQATYINTKFEGTHLKFQLEAPEWSTTATRQQLIAKYWFTHVPSHFSFMFGFPAFIFFFVSGGFDDFIDYLATMLLSGVICYFVLYLFHYRPTFSNTYLPRLETVKEAYDRKQIEVLEKCRRAQLSNFALTLVFYVFEKTSEINTLLCNDQSAVLLMKLFGVDPGSLKKNLELIYGKKKYLLPRKQTEISNRFEEAIIFLEEIGFLRGVHILNELKKKFIQLEPINSVANSKLTGRTMG